MHEDLDTPGPAELEQLADNEAGEGRMPNCQHFRRLARKWREDREDRDALRHALLQATTEKARARRAELTPSAKRMAYAVALQGDHGITLAPLCKAPACAIQALSPFEGAAVVGLATIAVEAEAISGMQYRLRHAAHAALAQQPAADDSEQFRRGWQGGFAEGRKQPAVEVYAGADALIAYLDTLCDESDEKWDVAQAAIAGIRAAQQPAVVDARILELADRLVAPGPKAAHVSASECHELRDFIHALAGPQQGGTQE